MNIMKTYGVVPIPDTKEGHDFRNSSMCIACPVGDLLHFDWFAAFIACMKPSFTIIGDNSVPIDAARNKLVEYFLVNHPEASHLLFWDLDTIPPPDGLFKLWRWNLPIVSGLYHQKVEPYYPLLMKKHAQSGSGFFALIKWAPDQLYEVDATGMGFCLIRRDVFQQVDPPWFYFSDISEDFQFIQNAQKKGIKAYVDTGVRCSHLGDKTVETTDFLKNQPDVVAQGYIADKVETMKRKD